MPKSSGRPRISMMRPTGRSPSSPKSTNLRGDDHAVQILDGFHLDRASAHAMRGFAPRRAGPCLPESRSIAGCGRRAGPRSCRCGECGIRPPPKDARACSTRTISPCARPSRLDAADAHHHAVAVHGARGVFLGNVNVALEPPCPGWEHPESRKRSHRDER